jgi:hypothetical protein
LSAAFAGIPALSSVKRAAPVIKILFMASLLHRSMTIHWFVVSGTRTFTLCGMVGRL